MEAVPLTECSGSYHFPPAKRIKFRPLQFHIYSHVAHHQRWYKIGNQRSVYYEQVKHYLACRFRNILGISGAAEEVKQVRSAQTKSLSLDSPRFVKGQSAGDVPHQAEFKNRQFQVKGTPQASYTVASSSLIGTKLLRNLTYASPPSLLTTPPIYPPSLC